MAITNRTLGLAIAGGALASALLEFLYHKDLMSLDEARDVLDEAMKLLEPHCKSKADGAFEAEGIIRAMLLSRFSERR